MHNKMTRIIAHHAMLGRAVVQSGQVFDANFTMLISITTRVGT